MFVSSGCLGDGRDDRILGAHLPACACQPGWAKRYPAWTLEDCSNHRELAGGNFTTFWLNLVSQSWCAPLHFLISFSRGVFKKILCRRKSGPDRPVWGGVCTGVRIHLRLKISVHHGNIERTTSPSGCCLVNLERRKANLHV